MKEPSIPIDPAQTSADAERVNPSHAVESVPTITDLQREIRRLRALYRTQSLLVSILFFLYVAVLWMVASHSRPLADLTTAQTDLTRRADATEASFRAIVEYDHQSKRIADAEWSAVTAMYKANRLALERLDRVESASPNPLPPALVSRNNDLVAEMNQLFRVRSSMPSPFLSIDQPPAP